MSQETKSRKAKKQQNKKKKKFSWKKLFISLLIVGLLGTVIAVAVAISFISDAPSLDAEQLEDPLSTIILDRNGDFVGELGSEKRRKITYEELSPLMEDAVLATEDVRFWDTTALISGVQQLQSLRTLQTALDHKAEVQLLNKSSKCIFNER